MREWHATIRAALEFGHAWLNRPHNERMSQADYRRASQSRTSEGIAYDTLKQQLDWQIRSGDALELKIATFFTITTLVLTAAIAILASEKDNLDVWGLVPALIGTVAYLRVLRSLYRGYRADRFSSGPVPKDLVDTPGVPPTDVDFWVSQRFQEAFTYNENLLIRKADFLDRAVQAFGVELACFFLAAIASLHNFSPILNHTN